MYSSIVKCRYSLNTNSDDDRSNVRINPFSDAEEIKENIVRIDQSIIKADNNCVTDHFDEYLTRDEMCSLQVLMAAIRECKLKIIAAVSEPELRSRLIEKLIVLNEALHTEREARKSRAMSLPHMSMSSLYDNQYLNLAGHRFEKERSGLNPSHFCEVCCGGIKAARSAYHCRECNVYVHKSKDCLQALCRACPASSQDHPAMFQSQVTANRGAFSTEGSYIDIDSYPCPGSLTSQKFLCVECNKPLKAIFSSGAEFSSRSLTKFCHYYRRFYCSTCHWDNKHVIPSVYFMLNKWKKMSVCRSAFIKLEYMWDRALFRMPLFWQRNHTAVEDVLIIRKRLFSLRVFIKNCEAMQQIKELSPEWLVDQPYLVTMKFVEALSDGSALETVQVLFSNFVVHMPNCERCQRLCYPCRLCSDPEKLNVLSSKVWICSVCLTSCIHETCALSLYKEKSEFICHHCSKA